MIQTLNGAFGNRTTQNMLYVTVRSEFGEQEFQQVLQELNLPGEIDDGQGGR